MTRFDHILCILCNDAVWFPDRLLGSHSLAHVIDSRHCGQIICIWNEAQLETLLLVLSPTSDKRHGAE